MLLAAQSMAVGTVMVRWVSKYSDPVMATGWVYNTYLLIFNRTYVPLIILFLVSLFGIFLFFIGGKIVFSPILALWDVSDYFFSTWFYVFRYDIMCDYYAFAN